MNLYYILLDDRANGVLKVCIATLKQLFRRTRTSPFDRKCVFILLLNYSYISGLFYYSIDEIIIINLVRMKLQIVGFFIVKYRLMDQTAYLILNIYMYYQFPIQRYGGWQIKKKIALYKARKVTD